MKEETLYHDAVSNAIRAKKTYLKKALREEYLFEYESLTRDFHISDAQYESEVKPFWRQYGLSPEKYWFEMAGSRDGVIDPLFIPDDLYFCDLIPYLNNLQFWRATADKGYYDILFPDVNRPRTVCRCMAGLCYDAGMNMISRDRAMDLILHEQGSLVIKQSIYSEFGKGIAVFAPSALSREQVEEIVTSAGTNYVVQEKVEEHPTLKKIAEGGATTIRVMSMLTEDGVYIPYLVLRVNPLDATFISCEHRGYAVAIRDDDTLVPKILYDSIADTNGRYINPMQWKDAPASFRENAGPLPGMDRIREQVRRMHPRLPHFRWLGWDFMVDKTGEAVFIEFNTAPGCFRSQTASCVPFFGDMTEWVLDDYFNKRTLENNQRQGLLVQ